MPCSASTSCHIGNLGLIANTKGDIDIQSRDVAQAVIGNLAHDLMRLGLSPASAARGSNLPGVTTAKILEQMMDECEAFFDENFTDTDFQKTKNLSALLASCFHVRLNERRIS